jgi:hypothetical protein
VPIEIKEDLASGRQAFVDASKHIQSVNLAPDGERVIVVARGDVFSAPKKKAQHATSARLQTHTSATPSGRQTANGLPTIPMLRARTNCISVPRMARDSRRK